MTKEEQEAEAMLESTIGIALLHPGGRWTRSNNTEDQRCGAVIESLSPERREVLSKLKSDSIAPHTRRDEVWKVASSW